MKINWTVLLILFLGVAIKLTGVFLLPVYHDVGWYRPLTKFNDAAYMNLPLSQHPPLGQYFFILGLNLLGIEDYVVRLVPFIFSLIELLLIYWLAKKWYDQKIANATIILWSLTFFSYVNALSPEGDGSIMAVFSIFIFYFFYKYFEDLKTKNLLLSGLFYGLTMLIKIRAVLFILPLILFIIYKRESLTNTFKIITKLSSTGLAVFSLFPLTVYFLHSSEFMLLMKNFLFHNTVKISLLGSLWYKFTHPLGFLQVIVVLSPLLLFLFLSALKFNKKEWTDIDILLTVWFVSLAGTLLTLLPPGDFAAIYPRYISFLLPPFIILCAKSFKSVLEIMNEKKIVLILAASFLVYFAGYLFNENSSDYWFYSSAAAGVYKISQPLLLFYLITALLFWFFYWMFQQSNWGGKFLTLFFVVSIAFNLQFMMEPIVDQTHPKMIKELTDFYENNQIKKPLFVWAEDMGFYLKIDGASIKTFTNPVLKNFAEKLGYDDKGYFFFDLNDKISMKELESVGGTVFILYHPYKYALQNSPDGQKGNEYLKKHCKLLKSAIHKTGRGEAWEC